MPSLELPIFKEEPNEINKGTCWVLPSEVKGEPSLLGSFTGVRKFLVCLRSSRSWSSSSLGLSLSGFQLDSGSDDIFISKLEVVYALRQILTICLPVLNDILSVSLQRLISLPSLLVNPMKLFMGTFLTKRNLTENHPLYFSFSSQMSGSEWLSSRSDVSSPNAQMCPLRLTLKNKYTFPPSSFTNFW